VRVQGKENHHTLMVVTHFPKVVVEDSMVVPQKLELELPYDPAIPRLGIWQPGNKSDMPKRHLHSLCSNRQAMESASASISGGTHQKCGMCTHRVEYYPAMKKNEFLSFATTWMELREVMLSEIGQAQKDKCHKLSFICRS
jgi:hypothetical protein